MANNHKNGNRRRNGDVRQNEQALKRDAYIEALAVLGTLTGACKQAQVSAHTVYDWQRDPEFRKREVGAKDAIADRLETVALSRGLDASDDKGHILLIFLLKALRPDKYREKVAVEHSGSIAFAGLAIRAQEVEAEYDARLTQRSPN